MKLTKDIKFNKDGLIPAIAQDADSGEVLMLAYMNAEGNPTCFFQQITEKDLES